MSFSLFNSIFVINLKKSTDRRKKMETISFNPIFKQIPFNFIDAVDGQIMNETNEPLLNLVSIYNGWSEPFSGRTMTKGEVGCALSHYKIWKNIIENNLERVLILEDDLIINENCNFNNSDIISSIEKEIIENKQQNFDLLYLGRREINTPKTIIVNYDNEIKVSEHLTKPFFSYCAHSYVLSLEGAKKLVHSKFLQNLIPLDEYIPMLYDIQNFKHPNKEKESKIVHHFSNEIDFPKLNVLATNPNIFFQSNGKDYKSHTYHTDPFINSNSNSETNYIIIAVATENNEPLQRFMRSCEIYNNPYKILGLGKQWKGGNLEKGPGGGQKINLLKEELLSWSIEKLENTIVLFTDSYDVIINSNKDEILSKYNNKDNKEQPILFSAERFCWPDKNLESFYPKTSSPYKFLNSGGFIGKAINILSIINNKNIKDNEDEQLYFTKIFLENNNLINLDYKCQIFQTLNGSKNDINIIYEKSRLYNKITNESPCVIHGNGPEPIKLFLDKLGNYLGDGWNLTYKFCNKTSIKHKDNLKIFIVSNLNYDFVENIENITMTIFNFKNYRDSIKAFLQSNYDYYLYIDKNIKITNYKKMIQDMIESDKNVISPLFIRKGEMFSNFWGELSNTGYYSRSFDYIDIINYNRKAVWNVPYISSIFMIKRNILEKLPEILVENIDNKNLDLDMRMCYNFRKNKIFMYTVNLDNYGFIEDKKEYNEDFSIYDIFKNKEKWENKYFHPDFLNFIKNKENRENLFTEVCKDAFSFPIFTEQFCEEIIKQCENLGSWSLGKDNHIDNRLGKNAYENFPTQDIHLNQINFEKQWEHIVLTYIAPVASHLYSKYRTKGTNISFVVKYSMEGQQNLSPHHDSSTYTVNIALNDQYEGGGCRFIRQDVKLVKQKIGYSSIHPGRLTHYHEGLPITSGKRYILVSFIN